MMEIKKEDSKVLTKNWTSFKDSKGKPVIEKILILIYKYVKFYRVWGNVEKKTNLFNLIHSLVEKILIPEL